MVGATVLSIAGGPTLGARPSATAPSNLPGLVIEQDATELARPALSDLQRWLRLGADGKRWHDYEVAIEDQLLQIVVKVEGSYSSEQLRDTCLNITSLVFLWDPQFQVDGEIAQIEAGSGHRLASCTLREPVPGGRPSGLMTDFEQSLGADRCWTVRCA